MKKIIASTVGMIFGLALCVTLGKAATSNGYTYDVSGKNVTLTGYAGSQAKTLVVPDRMGSQKVTAVKAGTFANCPNLQAVIFRGKASFAYDEAHPTFATGSSITFYGQGDSGLSTYAASSGNTFVQWKSIANISVKKDKGMKSATISWSAMSGAKGYALYRKTGAKGTYSCIQKTTSTSYKNTGLKPGKTYYYAVAPMMPIVTGETVQGIISKAVGIGLKPSKVKGFKASAHSGYIQLRWKRNKSVAGYQISRKVHLKIKLKGFKSKYYHLKTIKGNKKHALRNVRLVRGMRYSYRIRTYIKVGKKKVYSDWVTIKKKKAR